MFRCCTSIPEDWADPDALYPIKPDCREDVPVSHFKPTPGKTLSERRWQSSFSEEGYLDIARVLRWIQRGGVHSNIKGEVWEFLLGCYDPKSTFNERTQLREKRRLEYEKVKSKCQEMEKRVGSGRIVVAPIITEDGQPIVNPSSNGANSGEEVKSNEVDSSIPENRNDSINLDKEVIQWKLTLHQIGLDVVRTDRSLLYYESSENQARLWDVLAVYSWIDRDIGYCQGMSDLCSPIILLIENEADAFWCFERLMRRVRGNFKCTSNTIGVRAQLTLLSSVIKILDPKLHEHIGIISIICWTYTCSINCSISCKISKLYVIHFCVILLLKFLTVNLDGGEYLFAFRMLMVLFRREFSFVDALYLWELIWSMEYNPHLFTIYEANASPNRNQDKSQNEDLMKYGKFERKCLKSGQKDQQANMSIFLVASILKAKNKRLLLEAKGLDDLVKMLNGITGELDAKKACNEALKLHVKYLNKTKTT
ncbi:rab GTPase-activating protein 22-like isoform X1 [Zingiber officinale]|uniref:rab GTPase-activating protein 22-like isoform X1 n=1 Tax=Zingiber officinale TaxID=94328 RepID=UPI001C4D0F3A|nr:rab GTPase-activating protein 22-like isoform X1 [Zingiber officinale]XP_042447219.1 rab GTPase-activating protein 22-like isoform X1 [Zingiber officinale]